ncbi:hypothetical protein GCM10010329_48890 [Streptomyces spiroverticillatus]|uniref:Uncharacterized protein n=1 Tax=Streptomyces finlayi TaxID=67296 RepID=A0A919CBQ4_9ACTN|nr:hypothetical protein [Streptomyces finlayi]GHA19990.1 hypothetical protein GCM10010329_48890 [Streptomyces spiroverticillatus]GHD02823.1 hypothetical protein GCM10010334_49840 [Streptomyces finlayi]
MHLIDCEAEPGGRTADGTPSPHALPDFLVLLNPAPSEPGPFRAAVETFDRPDR